MHSENNELAKAGHELAKCLDSNTPLTEIAKLIASLATALDVTTVVAREAAKQLDQVAQAVGWVEGGNFTLAETVGGHVSGLKAAAKRSEELAAENAALRDEVICWARECDRITYTHTNKITDAHQREAAQDLESKATATDAFLREVRAQARSEGINYAASRLAAAFDHGFVDKPVKEVADVVRMILTAKEDLANDALPAPDALSGEYAEQALDEWATELRQGGAQSTTDEIPLPVERELLMALRKGGAA